MKESWKKSMQAFLILLILAVLYLYPGKTEAKEPKLCTGKEKGKEPKLCTGKTGAKAPKLSRTKLTMTVGDKKKLKVKNTKKKVTWKSSKPKVVKVSKKGILTAQKAGKATIKAKTGKKTLKCKVTVRRRGNKKGRSSGKCRKIGGIYYVRTDGGRKGVKYPSGVLISSKKELQDYYEENRGFYAMEGDFKKTIDSFGKTFFKTKQLVAVRLEAGGSADSYRVLDMDYSNKKYQVRVEQIVAESGTREGQCVTCKTAQWHILVPLPEKIPADSKIKVKECPSEKNQYTKTMEEAKLDSDGTSARSLAEYPGIRTLTNEFTARAVNTSGTQDLSGMRAFSYQIFRQTIAGASGVNPVVSPISAYFALSMAAAGADGETQAQFTKVLGTKTETLEKNALCTSLKRHLLSRKGSTDLSIANSIWLNQDFPVSKDYLQEIVDYFDSEVYSGKMDSIEMVNASNQWANEKTRGLIPQIVSPGELTSDMVWHLMNAVYLKAAWAEPFSKDATRQRVFRKQDGSEKRTEFLYGKRNLDYIETSDAEGAVLPYDDGKTAFLILRPTDGTDVRKFAGNLDAERVKAYISNARNAKFHFYMPKADISNDIYMNSMLKNMGLTDAFTKEKADFHKTADPDQQSNPLFIKEVLQKVRIKINEKGTEAAAITSVKATAESVPLREPDVVRTLDLDSPYVYLVVDLPSQTPLFMGVMEDPK